MSLEAIIQALDGKREGKGDRCRGPVPDGGPRMAGRSGEKPPPNRNATASTASRLDGEKPDPASNDGEGIYTRERTKLLKWRFVVEHSGPPILWRERGFLRGVQRGVSRGV